MRLKNPLVKEFSFKTAGEQNVVLNSNLHAVLFSLKECALLMSQGRQKSIAAFNLLYNEVSCYNAGSKVIVQLHGIPQNNSASHHGATAVKFWDVMLISWQAKHH